MSEMLWSIIFMVTLICLYPLLSGSKSTYFPKKQQILILFALILMSGTIHAADLIKEPISITPVEIDKPVILGDKTLLQDTSTTLTISKDSKLTIDVASTATMKFVSLNEWDYEESGYNVVYFNNGYVIKGDWICDKTDVITIGHGLNKTVIWQNCIWYEPKYQTEVRYFKNGTAYNHTWSLRNISSVDEKYARVDWQGYLDPLVGSYSASNVAWYCFENASNTTLYDCSGHGRDLGTANDIANGSWITTSIYGGKSNQGYKFINALSTYWEDTTFNNDWTDNEFTMVFLMTVNETATEDFVLGLQNSNSDTVRIGNNGELSSRGIKSQDVASWEYNSPTTGIQMLSITYNSTQHCLYQNSTPVLCKSSLTETQTDGLRVGDAKYAASNYNGTIYDVLIFNYSLLANDLSELLSELISDNESGCTPTWTNQTNISVQNGTCNISDQYWQYWEWNMTNQCDSNYTIFSSNITTSCDYCTPDIQNLTYSWVTYSACNESDLQGGARNITQWDVNQCQPDNITNQTFTEYNESACDFCTPSIINTTYNWFNNTPCNYTGYWNSTRITVQWDENQCVPDNITNQTFYEYNISSCTYCSAHEDCNLCDKCVAGACIPQTALEDLKDECSVSYTTCLNSYTLQGSNGLCDGSSACDTDSGFANVSAGNVCISGTDTNPTIIVNCGTWKQCIANTCGASEYYVGYAGDGTASCVDTDWVSAGSTWNAGSGDVIQTTVNAISCTTSTALFCNSADHCSGDTRYDGYTCDGSGNCDVDKTDIGCCQGSYCNSTSYCKEADYLCHDTATDYTCAASNLTSFGVTPQNDTQDLYDECPLVQCDGDAGTPYYALWSSLTCYYRNDTEGYCDGSLACTDQATLCSSAATDGSTGVTCNCEAAEIGCTGTTIGSCNNSICAACSPNWVNGTNVSLGNVTPCNISNQYLITYTWNMTNQCDSNYTAYYQNISASCDYCSYSLVYSDWSNYSNVTCGDRYRLLWDSQYLSCCNVTNIASDCYVHNASSYDNSTVWGNYTETDSEECVTELIQISRDIKSFGLMLAAAAMAGLFLFIVFQLDQEHFLLKLLTMFFAVISMILIPAVTLNSTGKFTTLALFRLPQSYMILFAIYVFMMLIVHWLRKNEDLLRRFPKLRRLVN